MRDPQDDLFWLAFRYAHEELSPAEAEAFEERLTDDLAACEAVARAVELRELLQAASIEASGPSRLAERPAAARGESKSTWMQPVGWLALGAAACLAAVMAWQAWPSVPGQPHLANATLALAWAKTQADLPHGLDDTGEELAEDVELADAADVEHDPPSWMLAAVSGRVIPSEPGREN